ncbi:hypothetical protein ACS0TY_005057 [Phlomoides rotata]
MAILFVLPKIFCLLLLATTVATSARLLDEVVTTPAPLPVDAPDASDPIVPPEADDATPPLTGGGTTTTTPATNPVTTPAGGPIVPTEPLAAPALTGGGATTTTPATNPVTTPAGGAGVGEEHALSFFMHDILGGSNPSGRVVTGIVANSDANNLPFSKLNNQQLFPINGGVPLNTINNVINNNNYPSLVGLNGNTVVQSNGNNVVNGNNNQAFVTAGQLPQGLTLQQLMFGSVTVVDNEITEGHELGSAVLGKAQGFYMVSSSDGSSHTLALTALFHGGEHHEIDHDTISFFGVHRTATPISHIAIVGGTGIYENANGSFSLGVELMLFWMESREPRNMAKTTSLSLQTAWTQSMPFDMMERPGALKAFLWITNILSELEDVLLWDICRFPRSFNTTAHEIAKQAVASSVTHD